MSASGQRLGQPLGRRGRSYGGRRVGPGEPVAHREPVEAPHRHDGAPGAPGRQRRVVGVALRRCTRNSETCASPTSRQVVDAPRGEEGERSAAGRAGTTTACSSTGPARRRGGRGRSAAPAGGAWAPSARRPAVAGTAVSELTTGPSARRTEHRDGQRRVGQPTRQHTVEQLGHRHPCTGHVRLLVLGHEATAVGVAPQPSREVSVHPLLADARVRTRATTGVSTRRPRGRALLQQLAPGRDRAGPLPVRRAGRREAPRSGWRAAWRYCRSTSARSSSSTASTTTAPGCSTTSRSNSCRASGMATWSRRTAKGTCVRARRPDDRHRPLLRLVRDPVAAGLPVGPGQPFRRHSARSICRVSPRSDEHLLGLQDPAVLLAGQRVGLARAWRAASSSRRTATR